MGDRASDAGTADSARGVGLRVFYRVQQLWSALWVSPPAQDLALARSVLSPSLWDLFQQMQPSEQAHSLRVLRKLLKEGPVSPDLQIAALLHDVGKSRVPLQVWERGLIVIVHILLPRQARQWGEGPPHGWRKPFVVAQQHPKWGAEMARQRGASALTVRLIRRHQDPPLENEDSDENRCLRQLQLWDDES